MASHPNVSAQQMNEQLRVAGADITPQHYKYANRRVDSSPYSLVSLSCR